MDHLEAALLRVEKLEDEAKLLKADLREALEAIKALTMGESHSKINTGSSHVPVPASRSNNETTESSPTSSSSSTKAEIKPDAMEFEPCSPAANDVVRNRYGDPLVGQYVSPKKKDADAMVLLPLAISSVVSTPSGFLCHIVMKSVTHVWIGVPLAVT